MKWHLFPNTVYFGTILTSHVSIWYSKFCYQLHLSRSNQTRSQADLLCILLEGNNFYDQRYLLNANGFVTFYRAKQIWYRGRVIVIVSVRPSVRLSVLLSAWLTRVLCDETNEKHIFIPPERVITLVFWYPQRLVGDVPFYLKFALKLTHPLWKTPTLTNICI